MNLPQGTPLLLRDNARFIIHDQGCSLKSSLVGTNALSGMHYGVLLSKDRYIAGQNAYLTI